MNSTDKKVWVTPSIEEATIHATEAFEFNTRREGFFNPGGGGTEPGGGTDEPGGAS